MRYCSCLGCRIYTHPEGSWIPVPALLHTCRVSCSRWSRSPIRWHGSIPWCRVGSPRTGDAGALAVSLPCRPRSPAEVERNCFLPLTPLGAWALPAELQMLAGAGTAGRDLAEAAIPGCGSASGRDGIKERKLQHLLVPSAVTPPHWRGARPPAPGCETCRGLARSAGVTAGCQWRCPFQMGTCQRPVAPVLARTPRGAGRGGRRPTWRIPPAPFFSGMEARPF